MSNSYFGKLLHGGDYNPEQWLDSPGILDQDIVYFKHAKINEVSLGIFSWALLEPEEDRYEFGWLEKIIDTLYGNGISVLLSTPSASRPRWMAAKYPEVLRVDECRHRNLYGVRANHCFTSPIYREKVSGINRRLAQKFSDHPGVIGWHISNEYAGSCHCSLCQDAFRNWLEKRYQTVDKLNKAWNTVFWGQQYGDFAEVDSPSPRGEIYMEALDLDWKRFTTDQTIDFMKCEISGLKEGGAVQPVTTNFMYDFPGLNYFKFAEAMDIVSWDSYPMWHTAPEIQTAGETGMQHDIMRSIKKRPFLLMESCPGATNWENVSKLRRPGIVYASSMQAIAHGSDSVQYFQLRQSRGGYEKFHGSVIGHAGSDESRVFREVTQIGESLQFLEEIAGTDTKAEAAIVYDWENRWALEGAEGPRNAGLHYRETVEKPYFSLRKMGLNVDFVDMEREIDGYKVVIAPMLYLFRQGFEEKVREFVKAGGIFLITYWSGIVDESDLCYMGGTPYGLKEVMGANSKEIDGLYDGECNRGVPVTGNSLQLTKEYVCKNLCDLVKEEGAEVILEYGEDFYAGMPALTKNKWENGTAYYICADFEQDFYDDMIRKVCVEAGIVPLLREIPTGVEVTTRESAKTVYLFIQNFTETAAELKVPCGYRLWLGRYDGTIAKWETVVFKKSLEDIIVPEGVSQERKWIENGRQKR